MKAWLSGHYDYLSAVSLEIGKVSLRLVDTLSTREYLAHRRLHPFAGARTPSTVEPCSRSGLILLPHLHSGC
jgi:hypothetical protein